MPGSFFVGVRYLEVHRSMPGYAEKHMRKAHSGPPAGARWGRGGRLASYTCSAREGDDRPLLPDRYSDWPALARRLWAATTTTSEVKLAFHLGVHGYFVKPTGQGKLEELMKMIFHYWAESSVPPVKEFRVTAPGEQPVLKTSRE